MSDDDIQYFEDLTVGQTWEVGPVRFTEEDIIAFAKQFDPQSFHLDPAAGDRHFGGLIASGWHTAAACMRPFAASVLTELPIIAALGVDDLMWRQPVRPGDELAVHVELVEKDRWDDDRGRITFRLRATNERGELVHDRRDNVLIERRNTG